MYEPSWFVFNSQDYEISLSSDTVDGAECWNIETARRILREKISKKRRPLKAVYTVCPDRHFAVIRYAAIDDSTGVTSRTIEIDHVWDEKSGVWVPSEWTTTNHGEQGPWQTETSSVLRYSLNEAVSDETFAVELPVGTLVSDLRAASEGESDLYVLRKGNEKREVTSEERVRSGTTRQELLRTESGMAGLRRSEGGGIFSSPVTFAWILGILLLATAAGLALRNQLRT